MDYIVDLQQKAAINQHTFWLLLRKDAFIKRHEAYANEWGRCISLMEVLPKTNKQLFNLWI